MTAQTGPNLGLKSGWNLDEDGWGDDLNRNLRTLDGLVQAVVISASVTDPSTLTPANGDSYIVPPGADAPWDTHAGDIARRNSSAAAWEYVTPKNGWCVYDQAQRVLLRFDDGAWIFPPETYGHTVINLTDVTINSETGHYDYAIPAHLSGSARYLFVSMHADRVYRVTPNVDIPSPAFFQLSNFGILELQLYHPLAGVLDTLQHTDSGLYSLSPGGENFYDLIANGAKKLARLCALEFTADDDLEVSGFDRFRRTYTFSEATPGLLTAPRSVFFRTTGFEQAIFDQRVIENPLGVDLTMKFDEDDTGALVPAGQTRLVYWGRAGGGEGFRVL